MNKDQKGQRLRLRLKRNSGKIGVVLHNLFSSRKIFLCSELIAAGFYKKGDYLFGKLAENVLSADFDNPELFEEVKIFGLNRLSKLTCF